jgi:hypothetical protein
MLFSFDFLLEFQKLKLLNHLYFYLLMMGLNQNRVNQAVMNFEKGNIGVKDGTAIHRQGLYKLNDIVQKLRDDPSSTDKNRDGLALPWLSYFH